MNVLYLILLGLAIFLFLVDSFSAGRNVSDRGNAFTIKLLPLALALVTLVWFIQIAKTL